MANQKWYVVHSGDGSFMPWQVWPADSPEEAISVCSGIGIESVGESRATVESVHETEVEAKEECHRLNWRE